MARRDVLVYPDERLRRKAAPVTDIDDAVHALLRDLDETMRAGPAAVGIAAPQVGAALRLIIVDASARPGPNHGRRVFINPEITAWEGSVLGREGCLSVPDYTGNVLRAERITVEALDEHGAPFHLDLEGFEARVAQHEIDHLDGLLFLDRLVSRRSDLFRRKNRG